MASLNKKVASVFTYEGAKAAHINAELTLRRSVMSCLLWEKECYEDGEKIAARISSLIPKVAPEKVALIAMEARNSMKLRHVPLLIAKIMVGLPSHKQYVADVLYNVINRPDELSEFLALYWMKGKCPLANQVKKGLAKAFTKFNAYQLAKWDKSSAIKLRDVMFLCHPKPKDTEQAVMWRDFVAGKLPIPDTWEVELSASNDKKASWTRLLKENKLGGMALLRNLRNMDNASVDPSIVRNAVSNIKSNMILPFRYIAAARYAPQLEDVLETAMLNSLSTGTKFPGKTVLLLDVSGSMDAKLSEKSDLKRLDAACGLAMLLRETCDDVDIFTFSLKLKRIAPRRGFALRDAIINSQARSATYLGAAVRNIYEPKGKTDRFKGNYHGHLTFEGCGLTPDRLIVITDEQSNDPVPHPKGKGYMINVASNKHGVGYNAWTHVDGFSESVATWIKELETNNF